MGSALSKRASKIPPSHRKYPLRPSLPPHHPSPPPPLPSISTPTTKLNAQFPQPPSPSSADPVSESFDHIGTWIHDPPALPVPPPSFSTSLHSTYSLTHLPPPKKRLTPHPSLTPHQLLTSHRRSPRPKLRRLPTTPWGRQAPRSFLPSLLLSPLRSRSRLLLLPIHTFQPSNRYPDSQKRDPARSRGGIRIAAWRK